MDCAGWATGRLAQALCGSARGGSQEDLRSAAFSQIGDEADDGGLAHTRAAGEQGHRLTEKGQYGFTLPGVQFQIAFRFGGL